MLWCVKPNQPNKHYSQLDIASAYQLMWCFCVYAYWLKWAYIYSLLVGINVRLRLPRSTPSVSLGRAASALHPNGLLLNLSYGTTGNSIGQVISRSITDGSTTLTTTFEYNTIGLVSRAVLPNGHAMNMTYDVMDRVTQVNDEATGGSVKFTYDANGNRIKTEQMGNGNVLYTLSQEYDLKNRVTGVSNTSGNKTTVVYDQMDAAIKITDPLGQITQIARDKLSRETQTTRADGSLTKVAYDKHDQLTAAIDPKNLKTDFINDNFGQQLAQNNPDTQLDQATYDVLGNLLTSTDGKGQKTTYAYDALNRVTSITYADNRSSTRVYDTDPYATNPGAKGRLTWACEKNNAGASEHCTHYIYDKFGRIIQQEQTLFGVNKVTKYAYDAAGNLANMTYPSGRVVNYKYTSGGLLNAITTTKNGVNTVVVENITYYGDGQLRTYTLGGGDVERWMDSNGRLSGISLAPGDLTPIEYDANGRMIKFGRVDYHYDAQDRLYEVNGPEDGQSVEYDNNGNRKVKYDYVFGGDFSSRSYTYGAANNRLTSINGAAVTHDANGNITADGSNNYWYSAANKTQVIQKGTTYTEYALNSANQRIRKFVWQGSNVLANVRFDYDLAGNLISETRWNQADPKQEIIWMGNTPVAVFDKDATNAVKPYFIYTDGLGTPRTIVDANQNWVWYWDFADVWGEKQPQVQTLEFNLRFPGQYYDGETGLHYNWHRDYNPLTGRYSQADPLGLSAGWNLYAYAGNNPAMFVDPMGLFELPSLPDWFVNGSAAVGDTILSGMSFGLINGQSARNALDIGSVDPCSNAYRTTRKYAEYAEMAAGGYGLVKALGKKAARKGFEELEHLANNRALGIAQRGSRNPKVAEAIKDGQRAHGNYGTALGDAFDTKVILPSGKKPDAVNMALREVRELKPDNLKAIKLGQRQVEGYRRELEQMTGQSWTAVIDVYRAK